jgi:hypothetical protein
MIEIDIHYGEASGTSRSGRLCRMLVVATTVAVMALCPSLARAQVSVYHPFPDSNAVWGMSSGCLDGLCGGDAAYIQDYYAGDTLLAGHSYKRINEIYVLNSNNNCCTPPGDLGAGFLREDTAARKVYWRSEGADEEVLLYDFLLSTGDTLTGYMGTCGVTWTVQSVDSILIGSDYRKRINFESILVPSASFSIIEGIGSTNGLTTCPFLPLEMGIGLSCFTVADTLVYPTSAFPDMGPCGELPTGMQDATFGEMTGPTPNPSTGLFTLDKAPERITVYNAMGRRLFRTRGNTIDLSAWPPGVYTAVVQTPQGRATQRLVVVR